jgi:hypothetical protein
MSSPGSSLYPYALLLPPLLILLLLMLLLVMPLASFVPGIWAQRLITRIHIVIFHLEITRDSGSVTTRTAEWYATSAGL